MRPEPSPLAGVYGRFVNKFVFRPRECSQTALTFGNCLSGNISLIHGHFLPRGQYTPECRKGRGQDVSSADEIGIACVIAGDTAKHLCLAVASIVLTTSGTCSGGASRIDGDRQNAVFRRQTFDPLPHPPIRRRRGGVAEVFASGCGFAFLQSVQVFEAGGRKALPRPLLDGMVDGVIAGDAGAPLAFAPGAAATGRSVQISRSRHEGERNANQIGKVGALMVGSG